MSTGHQIIVADLLDFGGERAMAFNIIIQLGAMVTMPTMVGSAVYSGLKYRHFFQAGDLSVFALGFVIAFVFAMIG